MLSNLRLPLSAAFLAALLAATAFTPASGATADAIAITGRDGGPAFAADLMSHNDQRTAEFARMAANGDIPSAEGFESFEIDGSPDRPAFIHAADLDADGRPELIVSKFAGSSPMGSGFVDIYKMAAGDAKAWKKTRMLEGIKFPNNISTEDINGDGRMDIIVPAGFLATAPQKSGTLLWLEQTDKGFKTHTLVSGAKYFYHHAEFVDLDGDAIKDLVTVGEEKGMFNDGSAQVHFFRGNLSADRFEKTPVKLADGLGSIPEALDFDGDGDIDIASAEYFGSKGSFAWLENLGGGKWQKRFIDAGAGKAIQLSHIDNLFGDGLPVFVGANHTNTTDDPGDAESAVFVYEKSPSDALSFERIQISRGIKSRKSPPVGPQGAPGVFAWGDADGDGLTDIVVHGDGDPCVYLLKQVPGRRFETMILGKSLPQGGVCMADLDADGVCEIVVSSYENDKLLVFDRVHK